MFRTVLFNDNPKWKLPKSLLMKLINETKYCMFMLDALS